MYTWIRVSDSASSSVSPWLTNDPSMSRFTFLSGPYRSADTFLVMLCNVSYPLPFSAYAKPTKAYPITLPKPNLSFSVGSNPGISLKSGNRIMVMIHGRTVTTIIVGKFSSIVLM